MKCERCNVVGFSLEELLPDGLCHKCMFDEIDEEESK
jgi:hypothetical protein|tara:strand:+ start:2296 stop:2406 length:111 start_codon:yes stop_codon:yes gene_type:complete